MYLAERVAKRHPSMYVTTSSVWPRSDKKVYNRVSGKVKEKMKTNICESVIVG